MNTEAPVTAEFENLLAFRHFVQGNPTNLGALFVTFCIANFERSRSQLFQDLFSLFLLKEKRNGFFVEFGATNGIDLSNTAILERDYQWDGILVEPAKCWHSALKDNRAAVIDHRCVWSQTGVILPFKETKIPELSTVATLTDTDHHRESRADGETYPVQTVSLNDLLKGHNAPKQIDYLSIDTEGSELEILGAFKFDDYDISIITVEHNFRQSDRHAIYDLLAAKGYVRLFETLSQYDDWYVKRSIFGL